MLLCPTKEGLRKLIQICEKYAAEHDLLFNGTKSKLLIFGSHTGIEPHINVKDVRVPVSHTAMHLGNLISNKTEDSIDYAINKFNSSFNSFFHHLASVRAK